MARVIPMIDNETGETVHMYSVDAREASRNKDGRFRPKTTADEAVVQATPLGAAKVERFGAAPDAPSGQDSGDQPAGAARGGDLDRRTEPQTDAGQTTVQNEGGPATPELPGDPTPTSGGAVSVAAPQGGQADEPGSEVPAPSAGGLFS